jgi:hypothetical protein
LEIYLLTFGITIIFEEDTKNRFDEVGKINGNRI